MQLHGPLPTHGREAHTKVCEVNKEVACMGGSDMKVKKQKQTRPATTIDIATVAAANGLAVALHASVLHHGSWWHVLVHLLVAYKLLKDVLKYVLRSSLLTQLSGHTQDLTGLTYVKV